MSATRPAQPADITAPLETAYLAPPRVPTFDADLARKLAPRVCVPSLLEILPPDQDGPHELVLFKLPLIRGTEYRQTFACRDDATIAAEEEGALDEYPDSDGEFRLHAQGECIGVVRAVRS